MKIQFRIHYHTQWGETLAVLGSLPALGSQNTKKALILRHEGAGIWSGAINIRKIPAFFEYRYAVLNDKLEIVAEEWKKSRIIDLSGDEKHLLLKDTWRNARHPETAFYTSAFQEVIFKRKIYKTVQKVFPTAKPSLRFQIQAPQVEEGKRLCLLGNLDSLGKWDMANPVLLENSQHPVWSTEIFLDSGIGIEYKYGLYNSKLKKVESLESGENRAIPVNYLPKEAGQKGIVNDEYFRNPAGDWKGAGVAIPVFSLRSKNGLGVGEFPDIKLLVDWAKTTGLKMVQILPINDTAATHTWMDSYPYASISVYALHPQYLNIDLLGRLTATQKKKLNTIREKLNAQEKVDYEAVMKAKLEFARFAFDKQKEKFLESTPFKKFYRENKNWLPAYAAFCYLRDRHETVDFSQWGDYAVFSQKVLNQLCRKNAKSYDEIAFHYFIQFHLDKQLKEAADYARKNGIILKGDIPIGIYRYSMDAWMEPHLYNMNGQAGAPPDPFSETGQNWGFPTYKWEEMAKDGYQWWKQRFQQLDRYFDAFRIDHILGFFRIWEIPLGQVEGLLGHFNPALPVELLEFADRGISFDYERFCRPFINDVVLNHLFARETAYVKATFLDLDNTGQFYLKERFNTQQKVKSYFLHEDKDEKTSLQKGLFDLISNVLFLEVPGSKQTLFHPRIDFQSTTSYQSLDQDTQKKLQDLYVDYFYKRQEKFWEQQALKKLPAIKEATNMLICGEDLGMVPECVPGVMKDLGILSLEIQRMSKNPQTEFLMEKDIPYMSVCSPSTHDMAPTRAWWEEMEYEQKQRFYNEVLGFQGNPPDFCETFIVEQILYQHLLWNSMWTVFPLQDLLAMDSDLRLDNPMEERINVPAITPYYWRYRMHLNMEDLLEKERFNTKLKRMLVSSGRGSS
ncbi:MAG: 4-alpha-glucanotransferase [Bacteroidetes bacterium]|nr:4-alpha-glucanotransferase [Bacteroidota bacterium]